MFRTSRTIIFLLQNLNGFDVICKLLTIQHLSCVFDKSSFVIPHEYQWKYEESKLSLTEKLSTFLNYSLWISTKKMVDTLSKRGHQVENYHLDISIWCLCCRSMKYNHKQTKIWIQGKIKDWETIINCSVTSKYFWYCLCQSLYLYITY